MSDQPPAPVEQLADSGEQVVKDFVAGAPDQATIDKNCRAAGYEAPDPRDARIAELELERDRAKDDAANNQLSADALMEARAYIEEHLGTARAYFDDVVHDAVATALKAKVRIAELEGVIRNLLPIAEHGRTELPPGHTCGPEGDCDCDCSCMAAARAALAKGEDR